MAVDEEKDAKTKAKIELMKTVGRNLRRLRKETNLTQEAVADVLQFKSTSHYSSLENGRRLMSVPVAIELAELFNTTIDSILREPSTSQYVHTIEHLLKDKPEDTVQMIGEVNRRILLNDPKDKK